MLLSVLTVVVAGLLFATKVAAENDLVDPKADALFKKMSDTLGGAKTLRVTAEVLYDDFESSGVKMKKGLRQTITIKRPNQMHFVTEQDDGIVREGWYDRNRLTVANINAKIYAEIDAPDTVDGPLDLLQGKYSVNIPTVDLLYTNFYERLEEHILSGILMGERKVANSNTELISFETTVADIQLWLDADAETKGLGSEYGA